MSFERAGAVEEADTTETPKKNRGWSDLIGAVILARGAALVYLAVCVWIVSTLYSG
jgi:hypothetical protein